MTIKARKARTNKKTAKKASNGHDRRLLARAETETAEGKRSAAAPHAYTIAGCEFDSILGQLKELTHEIVDAWSSRHDAPYGINEALIRLHCARRNLETCVEMVVQS